MSVHRSLCKIGACEPFCGLEIEVRDGRLVSVRPDPAHPVTEGYACIKGMHVPDYVNDPERLLHPLRRRPGGLEPVSWETAISEIGAKLRALRQAHGPRAIATYWGNAADSTSITLANTFCHAFGSPNSFNVLSLEYTDRGAVAERVLGNENLILQPDAARSQFALLLGTNPLVTNGMTLLQRRPRISGDLKSIRRGGGKVVVVDPRRTETARVADEHVPIRPGTDLFLLCVMIRRILETGAHDASFLGRHATGLDAWHELSRGIDAERAASLTGIPRERIERLADEFAAADGAFATTRVGVQTSPNTTLTEWAVLTLNAITGNIDRPGGVYFNPGVFDVPSLIERFSKRRNPAPSRIGEFPQIFGGPPAAVFADDVLSEDPDRIRALVVVAGNPVITFPNTSRMEAALRRLELLVCIDIYPSDTIAFADYALPAATLYEKGGLHFLTSNFEPYPFVEWRPKLVEPRGEARAEWEVFKNLSRAAGVPFLNDPVLDAVARGLDRLGIGFSEDLLYRYLLLGKLGLGRLKRTPGGVKLGEMRFGEFLTKGLRTPDGRLHLAPPDLVSALPEALAAPPAPSDEFPLLLISGARRLAGYNSWTHHIAALTDKLRGNWATLNPADAARLGIAEGDRVRVRSAAGEVQIDARLSADVREGVVVIHQFWGHNYEAGTKSSKRYPGVNVNFLHDDGVRDRFSGMPVYNGTPCQVCPAS
ncbi:MAG: molybdopterin-dependent oxidoreductase [Myxococcota bacterium]